MHQANKVNGPVVLSRQFDEALAHASDLHRQQVRKGTGVPYIAHLLGVTSLALEMGADEDGAIAALLHDAVEDQDVSIQEIAARYGDEVAGIVADCTDDLGLEKKAWEPRKRAYLATLGDKPSASLLVSLSDKTYNARAIVDDLRVHGVSVWDRFTGQRDGTLWYYQALADVFTRALPGAGADRFVAIVREMRELT